MSISKGLFEVINRASQSPENTLLIIGTSLDGPARVPFRLKEAAFPDEFLGESSLYHAYDMARKSGANDIILYRLNGQHASKKILGYIHDPVLEEDTEKPVMELRSVSANEKYNRIRLVFNESTMTVYNESGEEQRIYVLNEFSTIKKLVDAINLDAEHGIVSFQAKVIEPTFDPSSLRELNSIVELSGGSSEKELVEDRELHIEELNSRLLTALFSDLEYDQENYIINSEIGMMDFGVLSVSCLYHNDPVNLVESVGRFCYQKSNEMGKGCIGVIGTNPIEEPTVELVRQQITNLMIARRSLLQNIPAIGVALEEIDSTWESNVEVVVGDGVRYSLNGFTPLRLPLAFSYAGLQSSLAVQISTTNKQISGFDHLSYELEKEDIDNLLSNGYISIIRSVRKGFVPYAETTYVNKKHSILRSPSAIRISHYVSRRLAEMLDNVIGNRVTPMSRREIMSTTSELTNRLLTSDIVKDFTIGFVHSKDVQGSMAVKLEITPHSEIRSIASLVKLPFMQGGS